MSRLIRDRQILRTYIAPIFGRSEISSISTEDVENFRADLKADAKLSDKSINNVIGLMNKILGDAMRWKILMVNPISTIRPIPVPEKEFLFWTIDERDRFLSWAKGNDHDLFEIVSVAIHTGLRRGELEGLLRDSVDFERNEIIVRRNYCHKTHKLNEYTKSKKPRRVPMNAVVAKILRGRSLVPMNESLLPFDYHNIVASTLNPACLKAKVNPIRFHDLRHSFASHLAMAGVPVIKIKALLGHSDLKTTMRYMHLAPGGLDGVTDVLMAGKNSVFHNECSTIVPLSPLEANVL
jgi:integrase